MKTKWDPSLYTVDNVAIISKAMRMQIDSCRLEITNALIIALIASTASLFRAIYLYRVWCENQFTSRTRAHSAIITIVIVSLGVRKCLISFRHVLARDKLVNHLIMGAFLILEVRSILHVRCIIDQNSQIILIDFTLAITLDMSLTFLLLCQRKTVLRDVHYIRSHNLIVECYNYHK